MDHQGLCLAVKINCPQGCNEKVERGNLKDHVTNHCTNAARPCKYSKEGCNAIIKKGDVKEHMTSNQAAHFALIETAYKQLRKENKKLTDQMAIQKVEIRELGSNLEGLAALKPNLSYSPLNIFPMVLPHALQDPKLDFLKVDNYTIRCQRAPAVVGMGGSSLGQSFLFSGFGMSKIEEPSAPAAAPAAGPPCQPFIIVGNRPIPDNGHLPYYFEITITSATQQDHIAIGFVGIDHPLKGRLGDAVGGEVASWAFNVFENCLSDYKTNQKQANPNGYAKEQLSRSDKVVVGCCITRGSVFFTVNGVRYGVAFTGVAYKKGLFPAIGVQAGTAIITVNFGQQAFTSSYLPGPEVMGAVVKGVCTRTRTKEQYSRQPVFHCITCSYDGGLGVCMTCVKKCHAGHVIVPAVAIEDAFCDCGLSNSKQEKIKCRCTKEK